MDDVTQFRRQLHELSDTSAQVLVAQRFRSIDREALKRLIENEETPEEWAKRMIRDSQHSEES